MRGIIGDFLVALACRIDPETRAEQRRLWEGMDALNRIARGEVPDAEVRNEAYSVAY